jgi:tetratricopeptide (TPR) repeat protein
MILPFFASKLILSSYLQCYKRILQLDPENIQGLHNLCVVYVERGNLLRAEACLTRAYRLAPNEEYVLRHLNVVRSRISKLQISRSSEEGKEFEDFENADDIQRYEENFDDNNLGGDFDDELGAVDLEGTKEFGGDVHSRSHKASLRKEYLVEKDEDSDVLDEEAWLLTGSKLLKQKPSETRTAHTVQASSVQSDYTKENNQAPTSEDIPQHGYSKPQEIQHSYTRSHQTNSKNKLHPTSRDPVFSNNPSSRVGKRQEKKSSETIFADSLNTKSQRKTLRSHQELNKHSSS